jgi:hypothetical protein
MSAASVSAPEDRRPHAGRGEPSAEWGFGRLSAPARREVILALLLTFCYGFFVQVPIWNENSRYDLVRALVDDRTTRIDPYHRNTGDKAFYDGHYYSDKAPGAALLGVPVYALMRAASRPAGIEELDSTLVIHALAFSGAAIPTVLTAILLLRFLRSLVAEWWALTVTVGYALGTIAFPFATMYFGHAAAACFLFAAFYLLWRAPPNGGWRPAAAGALAGWAVLVEYPAVLGVGALLVYSLRLGGRAGLLFVAGGLPPLVILLGYNWITFDHPLRLSYHYHAVYGGLHERGVGGVQSPRARLLGDLLFGPRGLLTLSPWLGLAPLGLWTARRSPFRGEAVLCGVIATLFFLFNASYPGGFGGGTPGPRHLLPALPFAAVLVAFALSALRPWIEPVIGYSLVVVFIATATWPHVTAEVGDPLANVWLPMFLARDLAETTAWLRWGLSGAQPLVLVGLAAALAGVAVYATTRPTPAMGRLATAGTGLLAALVLGFGTPLDPWRALGGSTATADGGVDIAILDVGVATRDLPDGWVYARPWAQLENRGGATDEATVTFSIHAPSGEEVWAAESGGLRWGAGDRRRVRAAPVLAASEPDDYDLTVVVVSGGRQVTTARLENVGYVPAAPP